MVKVLMLQSIKYTKETSLSLHHFPLPPSRPVENWVCGYTPILGLVIYDCLPTYVVPEFWQRPLMGPAFPSGFILKHPRPPGCNGGVCYCNNYHYCNDRWPAVGNIVNYF